MHYLHQFYIFSFSLAPSVFLSYLLPHDSCILYQWAGSCWYYLRFTDTKNSEEIFGDEGKSWLPVDLYVGGQEHAVLHLLYARFWHKVTYPFWIISTMRTSWWSTAVRHLWHCVFLDDYIDFDIPPEHSQCNQSGTISFTWRKSFIYATNYLTWLIIP